MSKKMTHRDYFSALLNMAEVKAYPGMADFITGRIAALDKKSSAPHKETEADKVKAGIKSAILAFLCENSAKKYTVTQLIKEVPGLPADISNQRATSLVSQMVREGEVDRVVEKRVSYFTAHKDEGEGV